MEHHLYCWGLGTHGSLGTAGPNSPELVRSVARKELVPVRVDIGSREAVRRVACGGHCTGVVTGYGSSGIYF